VIPEEFFNAAELRHSIRTPLNHIIGYCEMLMEDVESAPAAPLRTLIFNSREMVKFVQNSFETRGERVSTEELRALQGALLPCIHRMNAAVEELSRCEAAEVQHDLPTIRFAVERLLNFAGSQEDALQALAAVLPGASAGNGAQGDSEGGSGRLLVVDDSVENRDILRRHLERQGYGVKTADNGKKGLELLRGGSFDLVLLDVLMPVMDGFEVLKEMKADARIRETPVVMISALDESNSVVRCVQMGAEDYLMKPFDPVLLSARIGASLEKKRLRDEERLRTRELQELLDQLRRTQDQLVVQENLASLGALTAGIAHEIRNPLNFINNFASAAKEVAGEIMELLPNPDPGVKKLFQQLEQYVGKIDEHGKRADRIVRGMLLHARGKGGELETVNLKNLLSDAVNLAFHSQRAQDRGFNARLEMDFDPATGTIRAVPQEINRVFLNIVNNAFYAVWERKKQEGQAYEAVVTVRTKNLGDDVEISVEDNGPGIPADVQAKIFNPFFTTKPAGAGTGLGLSLSHEIVVRGHHGTIRAESEPGVRTAFIVTLPRGN
jgi:signal transduction histidine kinase